MVWVILLSLLAIVLLGSYFCYRYTFYADRRHDPSPCQFPEGDQYVPYRERMISLMQQMQTLPREEVSITSSRDGLKLVGYYYPVREGAPVQIQFHGYRSSGERDFCEGNRIARSLGVNTLVVCQRAHGKSEGHTICFGIRERYDCLDWAKYAASRFPHVPITLYGVSMGAATVLMASNLALPASVKGILADCPFNSPSAIIRKVCRDQHMPDILLYPFAFLGALLYGHFYLCQTTAAKAVSQCKLPLVLIHGDNDQFVPCSMSEEICEAAPKGLCIRYLFPGAGHAVNSLSDPERYTQIMSQFLAMTQKNEPGEPCVQA